MICCNLHAIGASTGALEVEIGPLVMEGGAYRAGQVGLQPSLAWDVFTRQRFRGKSQIHGFRDEVEIGEVSSPRLCEGPITIESWIKRTRRKEPAIEGRCIKEVNIQRRRVNVRGRKGKCVAL